MAKRTRYQRGRDDERDDDDFILGRDETWQPLSAGDYGRVSPPPLPGPDLAPPLNDGRDGDGGQQPGSPPSDIGISGQVVWRIDGPSTVETGAPAVFQIIRTGDPIAAGETNWVRIRGNVSGDAVLEQSIYDQIAQQLQQVDAPPGIRLFRNRLFFDETAPSVFEFSIVTQDDPDETGDGQLRMMLVKTNEGIIANRGVMTKVSGPEGNGAEEPSEISIQDAVTVEEGDGSGFPNKMLFVVDRTGNGTFADFEASFDFETYVRAAPSPIPLATPGQDYVSTAGALTFAAGVTRLTIEVDLVGDVIPETDELIDIRINNADGPAGTRITDGKAQGVIENDDTAPFTPSLFSALDAAAVVEGDPDAPGDRMVFSVIREGTGNFADTNASVQFQTYFDLLGSGPPATPGTDYVSTSGQLLFAAGQTERFVTVDIVGDTLVERDEIITLRLSNPVGQPGTAVIRHSAEGEILDDETVGPSFISVSDATPMLEGDPGDDTNLLFAVSRSGIGSFANAPVTVEFETWFDFFPGGTPGTPNTDYLSTSGTATFAAGQTLTWVTVAVLEDTNVENNEIVSLRISDATGPEGTTIVENEAQGVILDDDATTVPPSIFQISDPAPVDEGDPGSEGLMTFVVTRTGSGNYANAPATVSFRTIDSTPSGGLQSTTEGEDYIGTAGVLSFAPSETQTTVTVQLVGDLTLEQDELLTVELHNASGPPGTAIQDRFGVGRVNDDDLDQVGASRFRIMDAEWTLERDPGQGFSFLQFEVIREGTGNYADAAATLQVETRGRFIPLTIPAATEGVDFVDYDGPFTFAAGVTQRTFNVAIRGDQLEEHNEGVSVKLLSVSGAPGSTIIDDEGIGVIVDDDTPIIFPSVFSLSNASSVSEGDPGGTARFMEFEVVRNGEGSTIAGEATVQFRTMTPFPTPSNAAIGGDDYVSTFGTLTFAPAQTAKTVSVEILPDLLSEANETVYLEIFNPQGPAGGVISGDGQAQGTIIDNEPNASASLFSVNDAPAVVEGDPSASNPGPKMVFDVVRTGSGNYADATTSIDFTTYFDFFGSNPQAAPNSDYASTSGVLTFGAGETIKQVTVDVHSDTIIEQDEVITLRISNPSGPAGTGVVDGEAIGFIEDDDDVSTFRLFGGDSTEEGGDLIFTVTRAGSAEELQEAASLEILTRHNSVPEQTATPGSDFVATSATLNFAAGVTQRLFVVETLADGVSGEGDEIVQVRIMNPDNGTIPSSHAIQSATIEDTTSAPIMSVAFERLGVPSLGGFESDPGGPEQSLLFRVTRVGDLSQASHAELSIDFSNSTASANDLVTTASIPVSFAPGQSSAMTIYRVASDEIVEPDEYITVALSNPVNGIISTQAGTATGGWADDDVSFRLIGGDISGENGQLNYTVIRSANSGAPDALDQESSILVQTRANGVAGQTATPGVDFVATSTVMTFEAGETMKTFAVQALMDNIVEGNETVQVRILNPDNGVLLAGQGIKSGTLIDTAVAPPPFFLRDVLDDGRDLLFEQSETSSGAKGGAIVEPDPGVRQLLDEIASEAPPDAM